MKYCLIVFVGMLTFIGCAQNTSELQQETIESVRKQVIELEKMIIPPDGTDRVDIDLVYGAPKEYEKPTSVKHSGEYPVYVYELLPPIDKNYVRAYLYINYHDGKAWRPSINHLCVTKGRVEYPENSPEGRQEKLAIEAEQRQVLSDLKEIYEKFSEKLKQVSWNK